MNEGLAEEPGAGLGAVLRAVAGMLEPESHAYSAEEVVARTVEAVAAVLPDAMVAMRLLDRPRTGLGVVLARGRLEGLSRERIRVTSEAFTARDMVVPDGLRVPFELVERREPVLENTSCGFDLVLCDQEGPTGVLSVEHERTKSDGELEGERRLVVHLVGTAQHLLSVVQLVDRHRWLEGWLARLLDQAGTPLAVVDRRLRVQVANATFQRLTGSEATSLTGVGISELVDAGDRETLKAALQRVMHGEAHEQLEVRMKIASGSTCEIALHVTGIAEDGDVPEAAMLVGQDLTALRLLERQVVHQARLATLGQLAAGVAHELNNPLTSISVYAEYLRKKLADNLEPADLSRLTRIVEAAERIQGFAKALVAYARPSNEEPTLVRMSDLVNRAVSFCEHLLVRSQATLEVEMADELPPVYGIRGQLEQVLVNLVSNACDAVATNGGKVRISVRRHDEERIAIIVSDDGCGIPAERLDTIFEPFFTTKPEGQGTGLGLSIVRNILLRHDGQISVTSDPEHGTAFTLLLYST